MTTTEVPLGGSVLAPRSIIWKRLRRLLLGWLALPLSALAALLIGALLILGFGANPVTGYHALLSGAFGGSYALASTAQKAVPLLLVATGICIAVRANVWNIGGEGQIVMGALASTATALALPNLPAFVLLPLVVIAAACGGAIWAGIAGFFKAYFNVNEILSTIMLNLVAVQVMNYLLSGPLVNKSQSFSITGLIPQTKLLSKNAWLPTIMSGTQLNLGVVIAVAVAVAVYFLLWRTGFGFRIRAVGLSRDAAAYAGMPVKRTVMNAMVLSGACCGVAGAVLVFGSISHRMVTDGSLTGFTGNDGFNGIVVALFGGLNPLWSILSAYLFGGLLIGGTSMQAIIGVPTDLVTTIEGLVVIFVVSIDYLRVRFRIQEEAQRLERDKERAPESSGRSLLFKLARARA
ncbi:MAG TPA: ABC transporter permease [Acidimicrobiales bacterium]|nr:ABC transporter permease [Acidimicrobiales bacterium]